MSEDSLEQRRREQAKKDRSDVAELRDEVANLVTEVHKFRGNLSAYAPRSEMDRELALKASETDLDRRLQKVETRLSRRFGRRHIMEWVAIVVLMFGLFWAFSASRIEAIQREVVAESAASAIEESCIARKNLENGFLAFLAVLRDDNPTDRNLALYEQAVELIESPPCEAIVRDLRAQ